MRLATARSAALFVLLALPEAGPVPATPATPPTPPTPPTLVAVGDIACDPADAGYNGGAGTATRCRMRATSDLAIALSPVEVLLLGDNQYENGSLDRYLASFDPTWGRLKAITRPIPGNHEYATPGAQGYFSYFGAAAGDPAKGWYSWDLGAWHLVALNSNCAAVGGCDAASPQGEWLAADLAAHPGVCTLAAWHHPRFSSGPHGDDTSVEELWAILQAAGADVVLNGHDHGYERFAPQTAGGAADPRGLRAFVVGTGGKNITAVTTVRANSEIREYGAFGVLELTLHPNGYEWRFLSDAGSLLDSGRGLCHSALPSAGSDFHTVAPCRLVDTRGSAPLSAGVRNILPAAGFCGIPTDAVAIVANATAIDPSAAGTLTLFPSGLPVPATGTVSFPAGRNRAGAAVVALGVEGDVDAVLSSAGTAHLVLDVSGYFR